MPKEKIRQSIARVVGLIFVMLMTVNGASVCRADDAGGLFELSDSEVVFLLDTSNSMNTQDADRMAIDAIRQAMYSLPSNYRSGLVTYDTDVQTVISFDEAMEQRDALFDGITYSGYTNAGHGLERALEMFSEESGINRYIVLLTDGEIDMPDEQAKEDARLLYEEMAQQAADRGIKIFITAIGSELSDPQMHIFDGAELTDGAIYWQGQSGTLTGIMNRILYERMNFPNRAVGVTDANGGSVYVELPSAGIEHAKIILTSDQGILTVNADYAADSGRTITGQNFAVVDMERPAGENVEIRFGGADASSVAAYMVAEYTAKAEIAISYWREEDSDAVQQDAGNTVPAYKHYADIQLWLADTGGRNNGLWNSGYYEGMEVPLKINGTELEGTIADGIISCALQIDGMQDGILEMDLSGFTERFDVSQPVTVTFSPPEDPAPEPGPDYRPLWAVLGLLAIALIAVTAVWINKSHTTVIYVAQTRAEKEPSKKMETKACTYTGKLNMYVVRTESGQDIPPQTYRLFGRTGSRMTLNQILTSCGIKFGKIGADDIIFYPGPERALIVMDQSERCTVLRGTEILKKGMGYPVYYNEKVTVTFEDEVTEMEIHYKNLKPSEQ